MKSVMRSMKSEIVATDHIVQKLDAQLMKNVPRKVAVSMPRRKFIARKVDRDPSARDERLREGKGGGGGTASFGPAGDEGRGTGSGTVCLRARLCAGKECRRPLMQCVNVQAEEGDETAKQ